MEAVKSLAFALGLELVKVATVALVIGEPSTPKTVNPPEAFTTLFGGLFTRSVTETGGAVSCVIVTVMVSEPVTE